MWWIIAFSVLFLVFAVFVVSALLEGEMFVAVFYGVLAIFVYICALFSSAQVGNELSRFRGEHYYEVVVTAPVPGKGTLVYAVELDDGNEVKADILAEYPMKGYKIVKIGEKTYHLPINTIVTTDDKGKTFFVSEDGEVVSVPMEPKAEGPVNPPLEH